MPLIPGVTDTESNLSAIAALLREHQISYVELLPYNKMAGGKYKMLMREYSPNFDEHAQVHLGCEIFDSYSITSKVL